MVGLKTGHFRVGYENDDLSHSIDSFRKLSSSKVRIDLQFLRTTPVTLKVCASDASQIVWEGNPFERPVEREPAVALSPSGFARFSEVVRQI